MVVTSQNAVKALADRHSGENIWNQTLITVGKTTQAYAKSLGFKSVQTANGNAQDLIAYVQKNFGGETGRFIYVSGQNVRVDIAEVLMQNGFQAIRWNIYDNGPVQSVPIIDYARIQYIALYSALAAKTLVQLKLDLTGKSIISISHDVDQHLDEVNCGRRYVAEHPAESSMINSVPT